MGAVGAKAHPGMWLVPAMTLLKPTVSAIWSCATGGWKFSLRASTRRQTAAC